MYKLRKVSQQQQNKQNIKNLKFSSGQKTYLMKQNKALLSSIEGNPNHQDPSVYYEKKNFQNCQNLIRNSVIFKLHQQSMKEEQVLKSYKYSSLGQSLQSQKSNTNLQHLYDKSVRAAGTTIELGETPNEWS